MKKHWDGLVRGLVLIRLGQELGTDSHLAHLLADFVDVVIGWATKVL